ncbi:MAG: hypothetical protein A3B44_00660 [Candidatus Levybacteria bacterium RIFCSPLOWO2_01_FULL_38_21]|nr:MAG: hypothetical protein A3B44_00660 [Candidatus Levybacteria bacterium RIFCSPLOWO2_01_FULL_38_21]
MPEILTYNSPSEIEKKRTKQFIFKSFFDYFNSKDKFTKLYLIAFALIIIATPFIVGQYLNYLQLAAENQPVVVKITKDGFVPATIKIDKGTKVTWINQDISLHKIASDPNPAQPNLLGFVSKNLARGDSFSFIFMDSGTFTYRDQLNLSKYKGVVIVK